LNGEPHTAFEPENMTRDFRWLGGTAKLKPAVTLENARAEMSVIAQRLASAHPDSNKGRGVAVDAQTGRMSCCRAGVAKAGCSM
jgi:hypothetical protein